MINALVLGATGFIGGHIAKKALEAGWQVSGYRRKPGSVGHLSNQEIHWIDGDIDDPESLLRAMRGMDYVFHAAASYPRNHDPRDIAEFVEEASIQMKSIIRTTREARVKRLIYTSSLTTIGRPPAGEDRLADERDHYQPGTLPDNKYYEAKSRLENLVLEATAVGYDIVILNPTLVLGPGDTHLSSSEVLLMIAKGQAKAVPPGVVNIIDARDAAQAHINAARIGHSGERYILGGANYNIKDAVNVLCEIADVKPPLLTIPPGVIDLYIKAADRIPFIPFVPSQLRAYKWWQGYNTAKAESALELKVRLLEETARDSIKWFINQGIL